MNELFGYTEISDTLKPIWNEYWKKALGDEKQTNLADRMTRYLEEKGEKTSKNTLRRYLREALEPKGGKEIIRIFNDSKYTPALVKELSVSPGLDCNSFGIDHPSNITEQAIKQFIDGIMKQRVELLQELYPSLPADFMVELKKDEQDSIDKYLGINHPSNAPSWLQSLIDKKWTRTNQAFQKNLSDELITKLEIFEEDIRKQNRRTIDSYDHVFEKIPELVDEIESKEKELFLEGPGKDHIWKKLTQEGYILTENEKKRVTLKPWDHKQVREYCTKLRPYLSDTQKERIDILQESRLQDNWGEEFELLKKPSDWILYIDHFLNEEGSEALDPIICYSSALWAYLEHKSREYGVKDISKGAVVDWCIKAIHSSEVVRATYTEERFRMKRTELEETVLHSRSSLLAQVKTIFKAEKTLTKAQLKIERLLVTPAITQLFCDIGWLEYKNWNHEDVVELDTKIGYLCLPTLVENETILYASSLRRTIQLWRSYFSKAYIQLWCAKEKSYDELHSSLEQILEYESLYLLYVVQNLRVYLHTLNPTPKQKQQVQSWFAFWLLYPNHIELSRIVSYSSIFLTRQDLFLLSHKLKHLSLKKDTPTQEEVATWLSASDKTRITQLTEQYPKTKEHELYPYGSNLSGSLVFQNFGFHNLWHLAPSKQRLVIDHFVSMNNLEAKYLKCGLKIEYLQSEDLPSVTEAHGIIQYSPHEFEPIIHDLIDNMDWVQDEQRKDNIKLSIIRKMAPNLFWHGPFPLPAVHKEQIQLYQKYKAFFDKIIRRVENKYSIKCPWDAFYHFEIHSNKSDVKWLKNHLSILNQFLLETEPHLYDWSAQERYQTNLSNDLDYSKNYIKRAIQCYTNTLDCLWECDEQEFVMRTISQKWHQADSTRDKWITCSLASKIEQYYLLERKGSLDEMLNEELMYRDSIEQLLDIEYQPEKLQYNMSPERERLLSKNFVEQSKKWEANLRFLSTKKGVEQHPELVKKVYQITASITENLYNKIHPDHIPLPRNSYTEQEWVNMLKEWVEHSLQKEDRKKYLFHYYLSFQPSQEDEYRLWIPMHNHFYNLSWEQFQELAFPITQSNRKAVFEYWLQQYEGFAGYKMIPEFKEEHQQRWLAYKKDPQGEKIRFKQSTIHENIKQRKTRLKESAPIKSSEECLTRIWDLTKDYTSPYPEEIAQPIIDWFQQNNDWEQWKGYDLRDIIDTGIFVHNEALFKRLLLLCINNHSPSAQFLLRYQQQYPEFINNLLPDIDIKWEIHFTHSKTYGHHNHQLFVAWKEWATPTQCEEVRKAFVNRELKNTGLGKFLQYSFVKSNYKEMGIQEWKRWHGSQEGYILSIFTIKDGFTPDELVQKFRTDPSPEHEHKDFIRTLIKEFLESNYFAYVDALHLLLSSVAHEE